MSTEATMERATPLVGGLIAYAASFRIGASGLVPEVNRAHSFRAYLAHFAAFGARLGLLWPISVVGRAH